MHGAAFYHAVVSTKGTVKMKEIFSRPIRGYQDKGNEQHGSSQASSGSVGLRIARFIRYPRSKQRDVPTEAANEPSRITWDTSQTAHVCVERSAAIGIIKQLTKDSKSIVGKDCMNLLKHIESLSAGDTMVTVSKVAEGSVKSREQLGRFAKVSPQEANRRFAVPVSVWVALEAENK
jgi:hypothetical protein